MAIGKITCTCRRCGAEFTVRRSFRNCREADEWESWAKQNDAYDLCTECWKAEKAAAEAEKREQLEKEAEMPELSGSPKQVAWAQKIRASRLADLKDYLSQYKGRCPEDKYENGKRELLDVIRKVTSAAEWIDTRNDRFSVWMAARMG